MPREFDEIQDCGHFSSHFPSKIISLLTDNDVPIWMAVTQAMFYFAMEDAEDAPPALPLLVDEFTTPEQLAEILEALLGPLGVPLPGLYHGRDLACPVIEL